MSFGFGVGDFIAAATCISKVYDGFKEAPEQFKYISSEVASLCTIVGTVQKQIELPGLSLDPTQIDELKILAQGLNDVLEEMEGLLTKYKSLGSSSSRSRMVDRVQFGREDLAPLRARLVSNATMLTAFNSTFASYQLAKVQAQLTLLLGPTTGSPGRSGSTVTSLSSSRVNSIQVNADATSSTEIFNQLLKKEPNQNADKIKGKKDEVLAVNRAPSPATATAAQSSPTSQKRGRLFNIIPLKKLNGPMLLEAAIKGDIQGVKTMLKRPGNIDYMGVPDSLRDAGSYFPRTALIWAAYKNHPEVVQLLLEKGADVHATNEKGKNALHHAADEGHFEVVQLLLQHGANVSSANIYGNNALHHAAWSGHSEIVQLLLLKGANIDIANNEGRTALQWAAQEGKLKAVRLLIDRGADVNFTNNLGNNVLHHAAWSGHADIVQLLLDRGSDIHSSNKNGDNALHWAAQEGKEHIVRLLLENGVDISSVNINGNSALHKAVWKGHIEVVRLLLEMEARIDLTNYEGESALHFAAQDDRVRIVRLLLEKIQGERSGASFLDMANNSGESALYMAAKRNYLEVVRLLVAEGASIEGGREERNRVIRKAIAEMAAANIDMVERQPQN